MKKLIVFFSDGLIGNVLLNQLIPQMVEFGYQPIMVRSRGSNISRAKIPELKIISFLETSLLKDVVVPYLNETHANTMDHADKLLTAEQLSDKYNCQLEYVEDVNDVSYLEKLRNMTDVVGGLSVRFYPKFKEDIINLFQEKGFLWNLHTGLLPEYKGTFIPYHALENNETEFGYTLHEVAEEIDTGDIIAFDKISIDRTQPILDMYLNMTGKGVSMTIGALMFYKKRSLIMSKKQPAEATNYYTYPTSEQMQKWNQQGVTFARDIIGLYQKLFTVEGSNESKALAYLLSDAIKGYGYDIDDEVYIAPAKKVIAA